MKDNSRTPEAKAKTQKRRQQRADKIAKTHTNAPHNDEALKNLQSYLRRKTK